MPDGTNFSDIRSEFIEKVGVIAQCDNMPKIAGRLFGLLLFDGEAVAFGDLAEQLQVSRASVSSNIRFLEERSLVKRVAKPGERQDYFQLADDPYTNLISVVMRQFRQAKVEIDATLIQLPDTATGSRARLAAYAGFYDAMLVGLADALAILKDGPK